MEDRTALKAFALEELKKLVRIPSISFDGFDPQQVVRCAEATADLLRRVGFQNVELLTIEKSFPYVVGEFIRDPKLPTLLLYAHYDVQPPGREELWKSPVFEPTERDGRLYGRGTADDKAAVAIHAAALRYFLGASQAQTSYVNSSLPLPVNLKVIIEGEEEVGSDHLLPFLKKNHDRLKADVIVVTDTPNLDSGIPSMTRSLRGHIAIEIEVRSLKSPLHSGLWGGGVVDPVQVLVKMLSKLTDESGNLILKSIPKKHQPLWADIPYSREKFAEQAGVLKLNSVPKDFLQKIWNEPSFAINAIQASSEKLANNIICDRAYARIGIRISPEEKAAEVEKEVAEKLRALCPDTVELKLKVESGNDAWAVDPNSPKYRPVFEAAEMALEKGYGEKAVYIGCGGSIPFIAPFQDAFQAPVITFGVEDPYTLAHSENESLNLSDFYKAIDSEIEFFKLIGKKTS